MLAFKSATIVGVATLALLVGRSESEWPAPESSAMRQMTLVRPVDGAVVMLMASEAIRRSDSKLYRTIVLRVSSTSENASEADQHLSMQFVELAGSATVKTDYGPPVVVKLKNGATWQTVKAGDVGIASDKIDT